MVLTWLGLEQYTGAARRPCRYWQSSACMLDTFVCVVCCLCARSANMTLASCPPVRILNHAKNETAACSSLIPARKPRCWLRTVYPGKMP